MAGSDRRILKRFGQSARQLGLLALAPALVACAAGQMSCRPGERPAVADTLYFGTAMPGGAVSGAAWQAFIGQSVTPRFPQGLTAWDAVGQWQGADGAIQREAAHVLQLVHPDSADAEAAAQALIDEYKRQFRQESVLRVRAFACLSV